MKKPEKIVKEITEKLLTLMGVSADIEVKETENTVSVELSNTDSGLLIGFKGETLKAFQHIVRLFLFSQMGEETPSIVIDVNGYRKDEEERLRAYIHKMAEIVKETGQEETLKPMSSYKRRLIHMYTGEVPGVVSESVGEGPERRIVIKPKTE